MSVKTLADLSDPESFANRARNSRFAIFERLVASTPPPIRILDVGGTNDYWRKRGWGNRKNVHITTINLYPEAREFSNIEPLVGQATDLARFPDKSFDIAFSNSVIEHLSTLSRQESMAREMLRVARRIYLQTPNFWFPLEPHFHVIGWQWLPRRLRIEIVRRRACGWMNKMPDPRRAQEIVEEIRLVTLRELRRLFPGASVIPERFCGLVKSWTVVLGFQ